MSSVHSSCPELHIQLVHWKMDDTGIKLHVQCRYTSQSVNSLLVKTEQLSVTNISGNPKVANVLLISIVDCKVAEGIM